MGRRSGPGGAGECSYGWSPPQADETRREGGRRVHLFLFISPREGRRRRSWCEGVTGAFGLTWDRAIPPPLTGGQKKKKEGSSTLFYGLRPPAADSTRSYRPLPRRGKGGAGGAIGGGEKKRPRRRSASVGGASGCGSRGTGRAAGEPVERGASPAAKREYRLPITVYGLQITDYGLQITDYGLQITDYGLRFTSSWPWGRCWACLRRPRACRG